MQVIINSEAFDILTFRIYYVDTMIFVTIVRLQ